jgi:HEAT repeat protein
MRGSIDRAEAARAAADLLAWAEAGGSAALPDVVSVLARLGDPALARAIAPLAEHRDAEVRLVVAQALGELGDRSPASIAALVILSRDLVDEVRSWATFALAADALADAPGVAAALAARLEDPVAEVRIEAVRGLAPSGHPRAVDVALELAPEWAGNPVFRQAVEELRAE